MITNQTNLIHCLFGLNKPVKSYQHFIKNNKTLIIKSLNVNFFKDVC